MFPQSLLTRNSELYLPLSRTHSSASCASIRRRGVPINIQTFDNHLKLAMQSNVNPR